MLQNITTMLQITVFVKKIGIGYENREKQFEVLQEETKGTPKPNRRVIMASDHFLAWRPGPRPSQNLDQVDRNQATRSTIYIYMVIYLYFHMMNALYS